MFTVCPHSGLGNTNDKTYILTTFEWSDSMEFEFKIANNYPIVSPFLPRKGKKR